MTERKTNYAPPAMPVVSGCYMLFLNRKLVYIGQSRNVYARIESHRTNGREFDYAAVVALPQADAGWVETALIEAMETRMNRQKVPVQKVAPKVVLEPIAKTPKPLKELIADATAKARISERAYALGLDLDGALKSRAIPSFHDGRATRMRSADLDARITAQIDARLSHKSVE